MTASEIIANEINKNKTHVSLSAMASYHLLSGQLSLSGTVSTNGFGTTLYTGNGTSQSIVTGVDMATQWGNDATETFGGLVWGKSRSGAGNNALFDTVRGLTKHVIANGTVPEQTDANWDLVSFSNNGFSLDASVGMNNNTTTYASWNFQTTHRTSGVTNHGKAYTCHYNPFTGFTIVKYEGSGLAGHEIPHHLGRKLGFVTVKNLSAVNDWLSAYRENYYLMMNSTGVETSGTTVVTTFSDTVTVIGTATFNTSGQQCIMYGWANSYFDEANTLIGNYEVGIYQGTGSAGNKVTTRGKPAWVMIKRLDSTGNWILIDNMRADGYVAPNLSNAEATTDLFDINSDGFTLKSSDQNTNASGGQYLYMVVYDNDSGSGKSKYPRATDTSTLNLNATVPFANGIDANGVKNSILTKNETVSGLTFTQGKNYVYSKNDGTYGVMSVAPTYSNVNPANGGDFYNVLENKWYTSAGVAITESRNYLDAIVYADAGGQPTYVEQLPKTHYFDEVKANEFKGKNACTAWVNFDGTTTPPTIHDSYNIKAVIRVYTGIYDIYFATPMDNLKYSISANFLLSLTDIALTGAGSTRCGEKSVNKIRIGPTTFNDTAHTNALDATVQIFGGKN